MAVLVAKEGFLASFAVCRCLLAEVQTHFGRLLGGTVIYRPKRFQVDFAIDFVVDLECNMPELSFCRICTI